MLRHFCQGYNRQIKVFENLEAEKNYLMFSIARQGKYLPICGFLAQNKEIPNFYLKVVRPSPLAAGLSGESFA
jgi:hypothetical protein